MNEENKKVDEVEEKEKIKTEEIPQDSNNNKKKGSTLFTIALLVIIVLLLVIIVILLLNGNKKDNSSSNNESNKENKEINVNTENTENIENTENNNIETNNDTNIEKEITTPEVINNLSNKFDKLFGDYIYVLGKNDNKNLFGRVLEWRTNFVEIENPPADNDYAYFVGQLSLDFVEKEYYNLFGEKLDTSTEYQGTCAKAYYDKDKNLFIQKKYGCDAGWGWNVSGYRYKYTEDNKNAYIYVAVAVHSGIEKVNILTDEDTKKVYKTLEGEDTFVIDASNYDSFAKYKVTFKKDGNNYFYKSVQKIEEGK